MQCKTYQLLNLIRKKEDHFGILTREYDEVSNDINSVQEVIEMYTTELEELQAKIEDFKREGNQTRTVPGSAGNGPSLSSPDVDSNLPTCSNLPAQNVHNHLHECKHFSSQPQPPPTIIQKCRLRAHLPDNQFTLVEVRPGQRVRGALEKKLSHRGYRLEDLSVYSVSSGNLVSWDDDAAGVSLVSGGDLVVVFNDEEANQRPKHEFQRRQFFDTPPCSICHKYVFFGFTCKACGWAFHQRCVSRLKKKKHQHTDDDNLTEIQFL